MRRSIPAFGGTSARRRTGGYPGGLFVETDGPSDYGPGYDELLRGYIGKNGFIRYWDDAAKAPYLFDGGTFISYDDPQSLREKCRLVRQAGAARDDGLGIRL